MKKILSLIFLLILFIGIRIYEIDQKNLWFDEIYSWHITFGSIEKIISDTTGDIHPPLYYIILKFWIFLFSDSVTSMRLLSVLFSLGGFYFLYKLLKKTVKDNYLIILTLLLFALSPLNLFYSQEVRMLSMNMFLCLGSVYYFFKILYGANKYDSILYSAFTFFALYTHYFSLLIVFTQLLIIFLFFLKKKTELKTLKKFFVYFSIPLILFLPWIPVFIRQSMKGQPWRTHQTFFQAAKNIPEFFKDVFFSPYYTYESMTISYFAAFTAIFIIILFFYSLLKIWNSDLFFSDYSNLLILFVLIPLLISFLISINQSLVYSRYLSIVVPFLLAVTVIYTFRTINKKAAFIIYAFFLTASITGIKIYSGNNFKNNDYRKIISFIESGYGKDDKIIAEPHFMGWSIDYHIRHSESVLKKPEILGWNLDMQIDSLTKRSDLNKLWFITDYSSLEKSNYDSLSNILKSKGYRNLESKTFYVVPSKVRVDYFVKD